MTSTCSAVFLAPVSVTALTGTAGPAARSPLSGTEATAAADGTGILRPAVQAAAVSKQRIGTALDQGIGGNPAALAGTADRNGAEVAGTFMISVTGACIGFLRYNRYPAKTFMGDTGSMLLGGAMAATALLMRLPLLLLFIFFTPVMSSVSVILQRYYFKLTHGKRIFLMSPIHHHFEKKGYSETQIVCMYADITLALSLAAVLSIL